MRRLKDFDQWINMDLQKPDEGKLVEITDADFLGWADFVFECYLKDGYFYSKDDVKMCAAYTISYWRQING